ncbi:Poly(ADP-ribose) polymerase and DNA-Ligase Zn-finger region family protein [Leishmania donovani]|uniref:Poly(ADP-ribose) polymerase and DNA-Ligase Zn-finger region family protein n=1 Tax=Leishmania donovani TaxID=5661 RepID=A0A504XHD4_LEIDO|nr:Poly(ADP-ribose) polymerase and DNA-Ligase Zn-finger region family protein [Leishmania donovani]
MPKLCVEYSKSGRAKCSNTSCGKKIEKHELRIGTEVIMPFSEEGVESWKWRHLCCFTERQLSNARSSGDIDAIQGEGDLAPADKALVQKMREGRLVGDTSILGRIGDIAHSAKRPPAPPRKTKIPNTKKQDDDADSEATEEYEVAVEAVTGKPKCPYGAHCFRTTEEHFRQYTHGDDNGTAADAAVPSDHSSAKLKPASQRRVRHVASTGTYGSGTKILY